MTDLMAPLMNHLTAAPIIPLWLIVTLLCASLAAVIIQYCVTQQRVGRAKALTICLLRLGTFLLLISFALNFSVITKKEHKVVPAIAVLLDTSRTMGLPGKDKDRSRLDEARSILLGGSKPLLSSLAETYEVRLIAVSESLRELDAGALPGLKAAGQGGNINEAVNSLAGKTSLALLLSDGTLSLDGALRRPPNDPSHGPSDRPSNGPPKKLPVLTIPVGDGSAYRDILIRAVKAPPIAFRGREVTIDATITGHGYKNVTIPVLLKDGARLLTTKSVHLSSASESASVSFSFTLGEVGTHLMSVSIPAQVGESVTSNNSVELSVKVVRDKTRIVMVSGTPSPNYRFMRMALKNDPSVDLLSFVILRTPSNIINVPLQEQSLIPFPVDTLFSGELKDFDLVIFDNLPLHVYLNLKHLEAVREFVRAGGGFALIGGPNMSDDKQIVLTPLGEVLPVGLSQDEDYSRSSPAGVRVTAAGAVHPVTRLLPEKALNTKLWNEMPSLDGLNLLKVRSSGTVLLESAGSAYPVLTAGNYGKGRVLALATDFSWKWDAGMVARGGDNWAYFRFIERMVRWLTKDPALDAITVLLPDKPEEGQDAEIKIKIGESQGGPAHSRQTILFSVFGPQGVKLPSRLKGGSTPGEYVGVFHPEKKGAYRVRVESGTGSLEETIAVGGQMELLDAAPNHELLKSISIATGGKVLTPSEDPLKEIASYMDKERKSFVEERQMPLWSLPYTLALVVAFLSTEWYVRRRWGLA